jgi:formate dehydrogenase assembly factor FdhD
MYLKKKELMDQLATLQVELNQLDRNIFELKAKNQEIRAPICLMSSFVRGFYTTQEFIRDITIFEKTKNDREKLDILSIEFERKVNESINIAKKISEMNEWRNREVSCLKKINDTLLISATKIMPTELRPTEPQIDKLIEDEFFRCLENKNFPLIK